MHATAERLRAWGQAVMTLSPVKRDLNLFMILTGMRRTATIEARIDHFDGEPSGVVTPARPTSERVGHALDAVHRIICGSRLVAARVGHRRDLAVCVVFEALRRCRRVCYLRNVAFRVNGVACAGAAWRRARTCR